MGVLATAFGLESPLVQMGWFFTKAALMTFGAHMRCCPMSTRGGGALPLVDCNTNDRWLALGETTPGPLIMVVSFVAFVGGWTKAIFGADSLLLAGVVAAVIATFFTFLPSFFFILLGGPFIESTHGKLKFTAPLVGITAAVVGVILNLAVFFAYHVIWPRGFAGHMEWPSVPSGW